MGRPAGLRRPADPRRHRRRQQGHPRPAPAGDRGRHRPVPQPLRAAAHLGQQLRAPAVAGRVGGVVQGRHHLDGQDARRRHLPQRRPGHGRGRLAQHPPRRRPEGAAVRRRPALADHRLRVLEGRRRHHAEDRAQHALRDPRLAPGRVHPRHHPGRRVRPDQPGRHGRRSPTSRSRRARPARSPSSPTTGAIAAFLDELVIQDFADDNAKVNALQAGQIQTLDNLPYNLVDTIKGAGAGVLTAEGGQWVPFTMRVDQAPFNDPKVRQAMRLIVDRQAMIDQTLSGYGSLGNDMYAPLDTAYASDLPQREQDIEQAKSLLASAGADGLQVELFTGDDIGSVAVPAANLFAEQAKAAGVDVKVTQEDAVLRRRLPVLHLRPGLLEHPQLHPPGRRRHVPARPGWHLQRDPLGQLRPPRPGQRRGQGGRRGQARHAAPRRAGDRVRRGRLHHLGLPPAGGRLRLHRAGPGAEQVPPTRQLQLPQGVDLT